MTQRELCAIIEEVLETEPGRVTPETDLTTLDTFDSVSVTSAPASCCPRPMPPSSRTCQT